MLCGSLDYHICTVELLESLMEEQKAKQYGSNSATTSASTSVTQSPVVIPSEQSFDTANQPFRRIIGRAEFSQRFKLAATNRLSKFYFFRKDTEFQNEFQKKSTLTFVKPTQYENFFLGKLNQVILKNILEIKHLGL